MASPRQSTVAAADELHLIDTLSFLYFEHEPTEQRVSKPGRRVYANSQAIKPVIGQLGISILTTSRGVIASQKAEKLSVGGEVICTVW